MLAFVAQWHRKLATLAGVAVLLWVLSGLLHPFVSYWGPRAANFMPPERSFSEPPAQAGFKAMLKQAQGQEIKSLRLVRLGYDWAWQLATKDGFVYYNADFGKKSEDFGARYAADLAKYYTGIKASAPVTDMQTEFTLAYPPINRLLPVYKISYGDHHDLTAYVDPASDRLGSLSDTVRGAALWLFQNVHTLSFLDPAEAVRVLIIFLAVGSILAMAVLGTLMRSRLKYRRQMAPTRKAHGIGAYILWIPVLMFTLSGLLHLIVRSPSLSDPPLPVADTFSLHGNITLPPLESFNDLRMISRQGELYWRVLSGKEALYYKEGSKTPLDEATFAAGFLPDAEYAGKPEQVFKFSDEYGFAYKRLPVWKFTEAKTGLMRFVDPADGLIAANVTPFEAKETWVFTRLHKWQFLDVITGKRWRDAAIAVIAVFVLMMSVTGLKLRRKRV
jgi:hypothetical protein